MPRARADLPSPPHVTAAPSGPVEVIATSRPPGAGAESSDCPNPRDPRQTPAMRQYARFKAQHPDCLLLFRMGDFYEMFDDDAVRAHKALGLTLTQRTEGVPMAGVPYHALEGYLRRLIQQGFRVAVCEQLEDPREAKGIVDRGVTRVVTPGTLVDATLLDESRANTIAAILFVEEGDSAAAALATCELSTGAFSLAHLRSDGVIDELARRAPSELLYVETADGNAPSRIKALHAATGCALTPRAAWTFRPSDALDCLKRHFGVASLSGFGLDDADSTVAPAGALLRYLQETQSGDDGRREDVHDRLAHLQPPRRESIDDFVAIDAASLRSLEIERTMRSGQSDHSLLTVMQRCGTAMGKRLLRQWLCFPLRRRVAIEARQSVVAALVQDRRLADQIMEHVGRVQDVARIAGRISMGRATPRDLVALGASVRQLADLLELLKDTPALADHHVRLRALEQSLSPLALTIAARCVDDPPAHLRDGGLFREGFDAELDEARTLQRDAHSWLAAYQKRLIEQTTIASLKVGYNQVFGYYIEITHANSAKVPDAFSRKQTLKNAERYVTPELKEFEEKVTTAEARAIEREQALFDRLCAQASGVSRQLAAFAAIIAELDVLLCLADVAVRFNWCRPVLVDDPVLDIRQGRHPVLDRTLGERFVPNDCMLGPLAPGSAGGTTSTDAGRATDLPPAEPGANGDTPQSMSPFMTRSLSASLALITGPNMAGKSTFIRQVALITLLAHTGSCVPAEVATIGLTDRIFTRIGAADELHAGMSTFMVEMTETANILHHATSRSLVILDEIGRGTSTLDGLSLAWAIAETLAARGCRTLFATHYHELTALAETIPAVTNLHVSVREWEDQIIFLYRILPGRTDRSYGLHVAKIAGLPRATVDRAARLLETLAVQTEQTSRARSADPAPVPQRSQLSLFTEYVNHPVVDELRKIDLDSMTPMQAFDALRKLREQL